MNVKPRSTRSLRVGAGRAFFSLLGGLAVALLVMFSLGAWAMVTRSGAAAARSEAQLCAAALNVAPEASLWQRFDRLQAEYPSLVAIALLDARGEVAGIYPHHGALESAARKVAAAGAASGLSVRVDGRELELRGAVASLNGDESKLAQRAAILLEGPARGSPLLAGMALWTAIAAGFVLSSYIGLLHWFEREVLVPLRALGGRKRHGQPRKVQRQPALKWLETEQIALVLDEAERNGGQQRAADFSPRGLKSAAHTRGLEARLRRAEDRATRDPLTGLRNRAFLDAHFHGLVEEHRAKYADVSLVMMDLDNFKPHNDTFGHRAGDDVLRFVGQLLSGSIRPNDHAVRYGGDEFLLLLPGVSAQEAAFVSDRMVKLFAQYAASLPGEERLSLSAGLASLRGDGCRDGESLLARADQALYAAKRAGKNHVAQHACAAPSTRLRPRAGAREIDARAGRR